MKNESSKTSRKVVIHILYVLVLIVCVIGVYILVISLSQKENDNIVKADSNTYFRNENPNFNVEFINGQYIKFETVSSYVNPIEQKEPTVWEKIKGKLHINQTKKGVQISLVEVSYDSVLEKMSGNNVLGKELNKSIELTKIGREFDSESDTVSKDTVISKNIYDGVDIQYQIIKGKGLKEEIVLNEIPQYTTECSKEECVLPVNRFVFEIKLDEGLDIKKSISATDKYPNGVVYIVDENGNYYAHFLPEYATDAVGIKTSNVKSSIVKSGDKYIYEIVLDSEWLLDKSRVFPIKIDPSIVHDTQFVFEQGQFDRAKLNEVMNIQLDKALSGQYTSPSVTVGSNAVIKGIEWQGFGQATEDKQAPFSRLDLVVENNFDNEGSLGLEQGESRQFTVNTDSSGYVTVQFWSYKRRMSEDSELFSSNLGKLIIENDKYVFIDSNNMSYNTEIEVEYNRWQYITIVFGITNSNVTVYIDSKEFSADMSYGSQNNLGSIQLFGSGYFDVLRVYERMLASNEVLSDSGYSDIYFEYMTSNDNISWSNWISKSQYPIPLAFENGNMGIAVDSVDISQYNLLSLQFLAKEEGYITMGGSKFSNGVADQDIYSLVDAEGQLDNTEQIKYIDFVFKPSSLQDSCLLSVGDVNIKVLQTGKVIVLYDGESNELADLYIPQRNNYLSISFLDDKTNIYLNGELSFSGEPYVLNANEYKIGLGCSDMQNAFDGEIENVRYSATAQDEDDILEYHTIEERKYPLKPIFRATLQNNSQILNAQSTSFSITQQAFGADNYVVTLNKGDTIVVSQDEYTASGVVSFVDNDTGLVTVNEWDSSSTFPNEGFSTSAEVLKWQEEYIPIVLNSSLNIQYGGDLQIKDMSLISAFDSGESINIQEGSKYVKYRLIFISKYPDISASISSVTINIEESGSQMEQIMRHGKWFNESGKQPYWWAQ